jgi:hypothetical protein
MPHSVRYVKPNHHLRPDALAATLAEMLLGLSLGVGRSMGFAAYRLHPHRRPWLGVVGVITGIALVVLLAVADPIGLNRNPELL